MIFTKKFAYSFRLYPTDDQKISFAKHFGCVRFIYNELLAYIQEEYKNNGRSVGAYEAKRRIAFLKKDPAYVFLKEVNSQSLQEASLALGMAFKRFFARIGSYPRFKKKISKQSFTVPQNFTIQKTKRENFFLFIPKLKTGIKIVAHRKIEGNVKRITIKKTRTGNFYASLTCEQEIEVLGKKEGGEVGIDVGLQNLLATSYGMKVDNLRLLKKYEKRLVRLYRSLCRKDKGSKNREKARRRIATLYEKIANIRKDFLHKLSRSLINENQVIRMEDLNIKGMLKNHHLAQAISDAAWGMFFKMLIYKAAWYGVLIEKTDRFAPTSKLCSNCGTKNQELKLSDRKWVCSTCGAVHDRDINAAKNIKKLGRGTPKVKPVERLAYTFSTKKMQADLLKQEPNVPI